MDAILGERIRRLRRDKGLSQTALAERLGITFQQVQKYENGSNRVSAMALVKLAAALDVSPASLLSELSGGVGGGAGAPDEGLLERLVDAFNRIESPEVQKALLAIAENLARTPSLAAVTAD